MRKWHEESKFDETFTAGAKLLKRFCYNDKAR